MLLALVLALGASGAGSALPEPVLGADRDAASADIGLPPPPFGLAHVDLMDLHLARRPDGGVEAAERLAPSDLAERYARAAAAGGAWNRWSLYWDLVEQERGRYDWRVPDAIVERDRAAGLRSLLILQGTPAFRAAAAEVERTALIASGPGRRLPDPFDLRPSDAIGARPDAPPPAGLDGPIFLDSAGAGTDDPSRAVRVHPDHAWAGFVAAAARRYAPGGELAVARGWASGEGVRAWEIGNEPNLVHFWSGTPAQFARYLEVAYLVIHWIDPEATVLHGGIADDARAADWYGRFLDALQARARQSPLVERHGWYFDAAGWHWYVYPNLLVTGPTQARRLLSERGLPVKPIWVTEMGIPIWNEHPGPCWDPNSPWRATTAEQAGYVWQALAEGLASGVEVQILFQLYDDCGNGPSSYDAFGLVRNHASNQCWTPPEGQTCWRLDPALAGQPRPAYAALALAARELAGAELLWRPPRDADFTQRLLFYRPPDRRVQLVWNWLRSEREVELFATGPEAEIHELDAAGALQSRLAQPVGGRHRLRLSGTTNRNNPGNQSPVLAGRPVMIVERDTYGPFRAQVEPLPTSLPAGELALTIAAADGGTGVAAYQLAVAVDVEPSSASDWQLAGEARAWPADALSGTASWTYRLDSGRRYWFAARAQDRAGNWSALPDAAQAWTRAEGPTPPPASPDPTASATRRPTPLPSPDPTASPTPVPGSATASATPTDPVPTGTPRATLAYPAAGFLPMLLRASRAELRCTDVEVSVLGPRGELLAPRPDAGWWLLDLLPGGLLQRREAELGESICAYQAEDLGAWYPGYIPWSGQRPQPVNEIHLALQPNALSNGDFELVGVLTGWTRSGSTLPQQVSGPEVLSWEAALLGQDFVGQPELGGGGNSTLGQALTLPEGEVVLSGIHRMDGRPTCEGTRCRLLDRLEVILVDEAAGRQATYLSSSRPLREDTAGRWEGFHYDLSPWAGRRVELLFNLYQPDALDPSRAWLDNLAVGRPEPGAAAAPLGGRSDGP